MGAAAQLLQGERRGGLWRRGREEEGGELWEKIMDLIQTAFHEGGMADEATWQTAVLIQKGRKEYKGIGIVEEMRKVMAEILHRRLTASITYHDFLYGFCLVAAHVPPPSRPSCFSI